MIQTFACDATHCELCGVPRYLYPFVEDHTLCSDCGEKLEREGLLHPPCDRCGRTYSHQFFCFICHFPICYVCAYLEHDTDPCDRYSE